MHFSLRPTCIPQAFFLLWLLLGFPAAGSATELPDPFTPKPKERHNVLAEKLARVVWRGFHNRGSIARLVDKRYGLVVGGYQSGGTTYPGPTQLCPNDPELGRAVAQIGAEISRGLQQHDGSKPPSPSCTVAEQLWCTVEHGLIDPPDSDFSRQWLFFQVGPAGRLVLRSVYFGYYDDENEARNTGAAPLKPCP